MTIRSTLLGLGLILTAGSAFALPPLPPLPPSPSVVAHRIQSDTDHLLGRTDARDHDHDHDWDDNHGRHHAYGHHHHHACSHHNHHGECTRW